jgi:hypothetical protein
VLSYKVILDQEFLPPSLPLQQFSLCLKEGVGNVVGLDKESWSQYIYSSYTKVTSALLLPFPFRESSISVQHLSTFNSRKQLNVPLVPTLLL